MSNESRVCAANEAANIKVKIRKKRTRFIVRYPSTEERVLFCRVRILYRINLPAESTNTY